MNAIKIGSSVSLLALLSPAAIAQESMFATLPPGFAMTYMLPVPFATINVGNNAVADAAATTDRTVIIQGHASGQTNFLFLDAQGKEVVNLLVVVSSPGTPVGVVHIHSKLDNLHAYWAYQCLPRPGVQADDKTGNPCYRIEDKLEGSDRVPPPRVVIQQTFVNPPSDNTPPR